MTVPLVVPKLKVNAPEALDEAPAAELATANNAPPAGPLLFAVAPSGFVVQKTPEVLHVPLPPKLELLVPSTSQYALVCACASRARPKAQRRAKTPFPTKERGASGIEVEEFSGEVTRFIGS